MSEPVETPQPQHECEFCHSTIDVEWQEDPYASEVYADDTPHWICAGCCEQSAADIAPVSHEGGGCMPYVLGLWSGVMMTAGFVALGRVLNPYIIAYLTAGAQ